MMADRGRLETVVRAHRVARERLVCLALKISSGRGVVVGGPSRAIADIGHPRAQALDQSVVGIGDDPNEASPVSPRERFRFVLNDL